MDDNDLIGCGGKWNETEVSRFFNVLKESASSDSGYHELVCHFNDGKDVKISSERRLSKNKKILNSLKKDLIGSIGDNLDCEIFNINGNKDIKFNIWNKNGVKFHINADFHEGAHYDLVEYFENVLSCGEMED